jgi:DNA topoisomerase-1
MLAIPPAWTRVWICPNPHGHLQATGLDARGRKQYRYHNQWTQVRNLVKFDRMLEFGRALPGIRRRVMRNLARPGLPKEKVCACVVRLLDAALIRVGNDEYAKENGSYGLTTIRNNHARVSGDEIHFNFKAKSGQRCDITVRAPRAAKIVRRCQELPGQELFGYVDGDGHPRDIGSGDINEYLLSITGERFTAKDFRTWAGTTIAAATLEGFAETHPPGANGRSRAATIKKSELKRREVAAVRAAAGALCNTVAVCRKFYVHPRLILGHADGALHAAFQRARRTGGAALLRAEERAVLAWLRGSRGPAPITRTRPNRTADTPGSPRR